MCPDWEETGMISGRFKLFKTVLNEDALFVRHVRQQELMIKRMDAQTCRLGRKIEKQVVVLNMKGLTYTLDPTALSAFLRTVKIDEACYPQRLETFFIINSPWFFRAVWALISPFIDPVTSTKIRILGGDYLKVLREAIDDVSAALQNRYIHHENEVCSCFQSYLFYEIPSLACL